MFRPLGAWKLTNDEEQLNQLIRQFDQPIKAVVETTSSWYWLSDWTESREIDLVLAHAKMLKAIAYAKVKTDSIDAQTMAELLAADLIPQPHQFIAPDYLEIEFLSAISKKVRAGLFGKDEASLKREQFLKLPVRLIPVELICELAFELATEYPITFYDVMFLATAIDQKDLGYLTISLR